MDPRPVDDAGQPDADHPEESPVPADRVRSALRFLPHPVRWVVVAVTGTALIVAGLAMMVLPGPGLLTLFAGVAVLAAEFAWAKVLLRRMSEAGATVWSLVRRRGR
ncbi:PGPGW domain-containing protein [Actinotalea sp. K2]|uniref:PGPGW domain-containing protein n=1 Tax=Actinotalea sp. K2 TaxID=2939438 RepID=UPI002016BD3E|nr:PGPGW domain-containing protein [Actinotalea sp. K2]MCL3863263.1 PGPGW domain-containing protein [Actinotalea sp. K2]